MAGKNLASGDDKNSKNTARSNVAEQNPTDDEEKGAEVETQSASDKDPDDKKKKELEESATEWPPAEYREWVQSQVANKMLARLSLIGISTILFFGGVYFSVQNLVLQAPQNTIITTLRDELGEIAKRAVIEQLVVQTKLVEIASQQLETTAKEETIPALVKTEDFRSQVLEQLRPELEQDGTVQRVILKEALQRAQEDDSDATRALGLEFYSLLYEGVREKAPDDPDILPIRKVFADIVAEAERKPIGRRLLTAILEYYPLGERVSGADSDCAAIDRCAELDHEVLEYVLGVLSDGRYPFDKAPFIGFLAQVPAEDVERLVQWSLERPDAETAREALLALTQSSDPEILPRILPDIVSIATDRQDEERRRFALRTLAGLNPHLKNLTRDVREPALRSLWASAVPEERTRAFDTDMLRGSDEDVFPEQFRRAVTNLLRTDAQNEWEYVLLGALKEDTNSYAAWAERLRIDRANGGNVEAAADRLLGLKADKIEALTSRRMQSILVRAIETASIGEVIEFANRYVTLAEEGKTVTEDTRLIAAILARSARHDRLVEWLGPQLAPDGPSEKLQLHLLRALTAAVPTSKATERRDIWRAALDGAGQTELGLVRSRQTELQFTVLNLLASKIQDRERFWDVVFATEESGVLSKLSSAISSDPSGRQAFTMIEAALPWLGNPLPPGQAMSQLADGSSVGVSGTASLEDGGIWQAFELTEALNLTVSDLPDGTEIIAFDPGRERAVARATAAKDGVATLRLESGLFAIAFRGAANERLLASVMARRGPIKSRLTFNDPLELSPTGSYVASVNQEGESGLGVVNIDIPAGSGFVAETRAPSDGISPSYDTYLTLTDRASGEVLDENDDTSDSIFSRIAYVSESDRSVTLTVSSCCGSDVVIEPDAKFELTVNFADQSQIVTASQDIESAPELRVGDEDLINWPNDPSWVRVAHPAVRLYRVSGEYDVRLPDGSKSTIFRDGDDATIIAAFETGSFRLSPVFDIGLTPLEIEAISGLMTVSDDASWPEDVSLSTPGVFFYPSGGGALSLERPDMPRLASVQLSTLDGSEDVEIHVERRAAEGVAKVDVTVNAVNGVIQVKWTQEPGADDTIHFASAVPDSGLYLAVGLLFAYDGFSLGDQVVLGRHELIEGEDIWNPHMDKYVGCIARIEVLADTGPTGSFLAEVDLNYQEEVSYVWRTRNMTLASDEDIQPDRCLPFAQP